jgi:hypothetical protein
MSNEPIDPTSSARAFYAVQLRRMRTAAKMTQADAGGHPDVMVSGKLIGAVENCYRPPTLRLSKGLDKAFGLVQFYEGIYASIKRESGIPSDFWEYTEQETLASSIKIYENFLITGLLQTEEYAREIVRAGLRADKLNEIVAARMDRQEILRRDDPPWLVVLLDTSVIRRTVRSPEIMRPQLERLLEVVHEPNITVRIVPDGVPVYPTAPFTVLGFHNEPDVGYVVGENGLGRVIEPGSQVSELGVLFDRIGSVALPIADSEKLIRTALEDMP